MKFITEEIDNCEYWSVKISKMHLKKEEFEEKVLLYGGKSVILQRILVKVPN